MADTARVSKKNPDELTFLLEVSSIISNSADNKILTDNLKDVLKKYFQINNFQIFVRDESTSSLRDFVKSWITISTNTRRDSVENIFSKLKNSSENSIVINNTLTKINTRTQNITEIFNEIIEKKQNLIYFPITNEKKLNGIMEISLDTVGTNLLDEKFFTALRIAVSQINTTVVNRILNKHLCSKIKFQKVMKNIAKLIETQFDLNYLLPIIGELIDRFVEDHLVYIFIKDENEQFKLFWPLDCQDEQVLTMLKKLKNEKSHIISKDKKAGVFAVRNEEQTIGAIAASSNIDKLSQTDIEYLCRLSAQVSITTQRANSYAQVLKYATLDALTGLNNRRQFEIRLKQETSNAKRNKKPLCCIMLDIDYFKKVNDTWGHSAGDCILKNVAKIISQELREYDIASRYGGEEFCILLPETKLREAVFVAQRLRSAVEQADINISDDQLLGGDTLKVTISVGVSEFDENFDYPEKLHQCADIALYEAKKRGRNRVIVYDDSLE